MFEWFACIAARLKIIALKRAQTRKRARFCKYNLRSLDMKMHLEHLQTTLNPEVSIVYSWPASLTNLSWLGAPVFLLVVGPLLNNMKLASKVSNLIVCPIPFVVPPAAVADLRFAFCGLCFGCPCRLGLLARPPPDEPPDPASTVVSNPLDSTIAFLDSSWLVDYAEGEFQDVSGLLQEFTCA